MGTRFGLGMAAAMALAPAMSAQAQDQELPRRFDGVWRGTIVTETGWCPHQRAALVTIRQGEIRGGAGEGRYALEIKSSVADDGRVAEVFAFNGRTVIKALSGRFEGNAAEISWLGHSEYPRRGYGRSVLAPPSNCYGRLFLEKVAP